jgi:hypothetical protein
MDFDVSVAAVVERPLASGAIALEKRKGEGQQEREREREREKEVSIFSREREREREMRKASTEKCSTEAEDTPANEHHAASASTMTALHARAWRAMGSPVIKKKRKEGALPAPERRKKKAKAK